MITVNPPELAYVAREFQVYGRFHSGAPYGNGHINDTFEVTLDQAGAPVRYIFQRINQKIFQDIPALMDNILRVTSHSRIGLLKDGNEDVDRRVLTLVPSVTGLPYYSDDEGYYWRCYLFLEGAKSYDIVDSAQQAREAARAFGNFQKMLIDRPGSRLHDTIPHFHDTRRRFEALKRVVNADTKNRANSVKQEIARVTRYEPMVDVLRDLAAQGNIPERITHNDTKLNNVLIDNDTQIGVCVIDLDTVMPGLALYDFGDMVRSATNSAAEDECDISRVSARLSIFEALVEGYMESAGPFLNAYEVSYLAFAGRLITLESGIRFLTDYLEGDIYYKTRRPNQNLDRARNQFALLHSLEQQAESMESVVKRHSYR
jgi:aminoglycoside phosphotransferase (APT) family kinase protein